MQARLKVTLQEKLDLHKEGREVCIKNNSWNKVTSSLTAIQRPGH